MIGAGSPAGRAFLMALLGAVAILLCGSAVSAESAPSQCRFDRQQFFSDLASIQDWNGIYERFRRAPPDCPENDASSEGYTDLIVHTLARRWSGLPQLASLVAHDLAFRSFVLRHIDASAEVRELRETVHNATTECPTDAGELCNAVAERARAALRHRR